MAARDIIVIGASAGGVETLTRLCSMLPADLPASIFAVVHIPATTPSLLPRILSRAGPLPASHPRDGEIFRRGHIYLAPPDTQMTILDGSIRLTRGPLENGHRPAIDVLFRSAAEHLGKRVAGVVLSGMLSDGALGLRAVALRGGAAIVQDPEEAIFPSMPQNALAITPEASILTLVEIADQLSQLAVCANPQENPGLNPPEVKPREEKLDNGNKAPAAAQNAWKNTGKEPAVEDRERFERDEDITPRTMLTCPECGGVLSENDVERDENGLVISYRCHVGHRYSLDGLIEGHAQMVERALWSAYRVMQERAMLTRRLAAESEARGRQHSATRFREISAQASREAEVIRGLIENSSFSTDPDPVENSGENG